MLWYCSSTSESSLWPNVGCHGDDVSLQDEWEALQVVQHTDTLNRIEEDLISQPFLSDIPFTDPKHKKMF